MHVAIIQHLPEVDIVDPHCEFTGHMFLGKAITYFKTFSTDFLTLHLLTEHPQYIYTFLYLC
jgi:hypothetical protein